MPLKDIPDEGTLRHYLVHDGDKNLSRAYNTPGRENAKEAITHYRVLSRGERYMLLEVEIETGRHHQIRSQLAHIGLPVKGDLKYGAPRSNRNGGIGLHARRVEFVHPVKGEMVTVTAPYPEDEPLWQALADLK